MLWIDVCEYNTYLFQCVWFIVSVQYIWHESFERALNWQFERQEARKTVWASSCGREISLMKDFVADGCAGLNQAHVYSADGVIKMER